MGVRPGFEWMWQEVPVAAGGSVMASGIVSVGLRLDGRPVVSIVFLAIAAALWLALAALLACACSATASAGRTTPACPRR